MLQIPHFINGQRTAGVAQRYSAVFNPALGRPQAEVALAEPQDVAAAVAPLMQRFRPGRHCPRSSVRASCSASRAFWKNASANWRR
nr:hypothetical protein [Aquitalea pelogenes]